MHIPVLLKEIIKFSDPKDRKVYLDCTFGAGGYTRAFLDSAECMVYSLDRDETVVSRANEFKDLYKKRFNFILGDFSDLETCLRTVTKNLFDVIVFDLGVSSMQIDMPERGFSFYKDGPLDMRMSKSDNITAYDIINSYDQQKLSDIFWRYGDEKKSRFIAGKIIEYRKNNLFSTTLELANYISKLHKGGNYAVHPATRVFQALRIAVNDELNQLQNGLAQAKNMLNKGSILMVVTFHSGEDIIVKKYFNELCGKLPKNNRHAPQYNLLSENRSEFTYIHKGVIVPTEDEIRHNPRSRSAKLRIIKKL
jgi:16S rRNA (cytosine1402-N4)-methyltransferase